jgi:hypothetical protein
VKCRRKTPPRWKIGKEWICGYPEIRPCNGPGPLPGHHHTKGLEARRAVELDSGGEADEARPVTDRDREVAQETLEAHPAGISNHWMGGYENLGSVPGIVGTAVMGVSVLEMVASTAVRMSVLYTRRGPGLWMMAAFWGTAFQIIIMSSRWALEWGQAQGKAVSQTIESSHRRGRDSFQQIVKNQQREEHRSGSATPAVQRGSVPRRLFFAAVQKIAIT